MVHRPPHDPLVDGQDSGRTIRLEGEFAGWCHATATDVRGEYRVHRESLERGPKIESLGAGDAAWQMVNWRVWCWRRDAYDALRIYLQVAIPPSGAAADECLLTRAFPSSITVLPTETPATTVVRVEFETGGKTVIEEFPCGPYAWNRSYCRSYPATIEEMNSEGEWVSAVKGPGTPFDEETEFSLRQGVHHLVMWAEESASREQCLQLENTRLGATVEHDQLLIRKQVKRIRELAAEQGERMTQEALGIVSAVPDARYIQVFLLNQERMTQRQIAAHPKIHMSVGWVNKALKWFRERGAFMDGQRGPVGGNLDAGQRVNGRPLLVPLPQAPVEEIVDPASLADRAGDMSGGTGLDDDAEDGWPGDRPDLR